ncbi:MAG: Flp pilus assembly complex ATPase component TadA [Phycisphaerae bacterium]|nr:Flp pilus assembly complex ATPase component TadA [Phycisphaerae bacterium]
MRKCTRDQVHEALAKQKETRAPIGETLVQLGHITEDDLRIAVAAQMGIEPIDLNKVEVPPEVVAKIPAQLANKYKMIPLAFREDLNAIQIALANPDNFEATDDLKNMGFRVKARVATLEQINEALRKYYPEEQGESLGKVLNELTTDDTLAQYEGRGESIDLDELKEMIEANPVKKLLNLILHQAIREKSSDVHFEPFEDEFKLRYRIDGVLYEMVPPPRHIAVALVSRIKVMSNLNIAERRMPQDGRIRLTIQGREVDLRVSILPTMGGESAVLRVLDRTQVSLDLDQIGMRDDELRLFRRMIRKPNGIIINTGPTGCGKTTTLYSALRELNSPEVKILTSEDPVEYDIDGLIQCQIDEKIGLTFARCLRSFLRQDPDIILVGEIRDEETAQIAVQASLTGHLVFSTLHTNDAPSAIARLLDLGLEAFLVTATLEAIVAQRLVRRICAKCKTEFHPTEEMLLELNLTPDDVQERIFYAGKGCDNCNNTGYRGRTALFETMILHDTIRELIMDNASTAAIRIEARKRGMRTLRESGLLAIFDGVTTIEEVVKETIVEEI